MKFKTLALGAVAVLALSCAPLSKEDAAKNLDSLVAGLSVDDNFTNQIDLSENDGKAGLADQLPDISGFPQPVPPEGGDADAEVFVSTEKSGSGTDGWFNEAAEAFNQKGVRTSQGNTAHLTVRSIASGTGYQFIVSGKYVPDGYSPSNALWVNMVEAGGVPVAKISDRLVGNVAGIVMKKATADALRKTYGKLDFPSVLDAVSKSSVLMGYTDPFASSAGLNLLQSTLLHFAKGDLSKALSPEVESVFEAFQKGVPFVALTTIQLRDSVEKNGTLDAFVMEYQSFSNLANKSDFEFLPFGLRHDNPLVALGNASPEKKEVLSLFAQFVASGEIQAKASAYGFNHLEEYASAYQAPPGDFLVSAQRLWKEKKDAGKTIVAVFLTDVSGSMGGERIDRLKQAMTDGARYISPRNHIGLVEFSDRVTRLLPIQTFDAKQKALYLGAVKGLQAEGRTAMYDGILVSLQMIRQAMAGIPDAKPMLFVLTDGDTNEGHVYGDVQATIQGLSVPIYTIAYGEDISGLKELSSLNEAATLKSDTDNVSYQIGSLLNAEM